MTMTSASWSDARWLNRPARTWHDNSDLLVEAVEGSDFWRSTAYGFVHDSGHALLVGFPEATAVEVRFMLDYDQQFDQAGVLVRADEEMWIKEGIEVSDGVPQLGAVVTNGMSDWSISPVPDWLGRQIALRASRSANALTVRARVDSEPWQLVRVAPPSCWPPPSGGSLLLRAHPRRSRRAFPWRCARRSGSVPALSLIRNRPG
jgi:regulation of enolase protein 1 (concanavalin A-like superfamily)